MTNGNKKKNKQLGMPYGTACNRLRKNIMFSLIQKLKLDVCFQCGHVIERVDDLSVEHKVPWLDSDDPSELFFDIDNIAFSHLSCNCAASRTPRKKYKSRKEARDAENAARRVRRMQRSPEEIKRDRESRREKYKRLGT